MNLTWTGSDVLFATKFLKHSKKSKWLYFMAMRIFAKIADRFVQKHIVVSPHLIAELKPLKLKKPFGVMENPVWYGQMPKRKHKGFIVLYYRAKGKNQPFRDWVYGYDIYSELVRMFPEIIFLEVNGDNDMTTIYPIVDFYLRPNRHDGAPRMVRECEINNIPYYWSRENPDLQAIIDLIKTHYEKQVPG